MVSILLSAMITMNGLAVDYIPPPQIVQPLDGVTACERCISDPEEMIKVACDWYGIDYTIPLAIAKLETGHFTSDAYTQGNNVGGMSINEVPITYTSLEDGVDAFIRNLAANYYSQGLNTVEEISTKYCPINADKWAESVNALYTERK